MYKTRDKERVLKTLIASRRPFSDDIYKPVGFLEQFPPLSAADCWSLLTVMDGEKLISVKTADVPESDDIYVIEVLPLGLSYFETKAAKTRDALKNWSINLSIAAASALFGAVLARLSLLLWP